MALNEAGMKVGDVVRLNAGGPGMAIESIFTGKMGHAASCVWFMSDGMCQRGEFLCCALIVAPFPIDTL